MTASALPAGADVLELVRSGIGASLLASTPDEAFAAALDVLLPPLDVAGMIRSRVDPEPVIRLAEAAAIACVMIARRELLLLTDDEYASVRSDFGLPTGGEDGAG